MTTRLLALLVLLTIVPAVFVLWFMRAAVTAESESSRQRVREAYRGQLRLVRSRLDPLWRLHVARLTGDGAPAERFDRLDEGKYVNIWLCGPAEKVFEGCVDIK